MAKRSTSWRRPRASLVGALPWLVVPLFMAACGFESHALSAGGSDARGGGSGDGGGSSNKPDGGMACAWATHFDACLLPGVPANPLTLTQPTKWTFDTRGTGTFGPSTPPPMTYVTKTLHQRNGGPDVLVLYTSAFTLEAGATLDVTGDKSLVIASDSTITIDGALDASSQTGGSAGPSKGPGASYAGCTTVGGSGGDGNGGGDGGGGGGGALGAGGGPGGDVNGAPGGSAGAFMPVPGFIRAGCAGGKGGKTGGKGGEGGGAIELAARGSIVVTGSINAGGGGGGKGQNPSGGGGGGSGGVISFDSPSVMLAPGAIIAANGGGGGGGLNDDSSAGAGNDAPLAATNAGGGTSETGQGGGPGGASNPVGGGPGIGGNNGGGGGGGGSSGYVIVYAGSFVFAGAVVSPPATQP